MANESMTPTTSCCIPDQTIPAQSVSNAENDIILKNHFQLYPKPKVTYEVTLTPARLAYSTPASKNGTIRRNVIQARDLAGSQLMKGKSSQETCVYLSVYSYPKRKKALSSRVVRRRVTETFTVNTFGSYEENLQVAHLWASAIQNVARGIVTLPDTPVPPRKPVLVLCNPCSGPGKALQLFQERVVPMLAEACMPYHLVVTDHAAHATEICRSMDLGKWYGVVIMSGDGLIYEAINGLMAREDWAEAIKTPIGCLPGGSGNALCCSLNHHAGEPVKENPILHSTFVLLKHQILPMDLVAVDTLKGRSYSFLSVMWGLTADVDIESEKYRYLGDARFTVGAMTRIFNLRTYRGKLSFLPKEPYEHQRPAGMVRSRSTIDSRAAEHSRPPRRSESMYAPSSMSAETSTLANGLKYHDDAKHVSENLQYGWTIDEERPTELESVAPPGGAVDGTVLSVNEVDVDSGKRGNAKFAPATLLPPLDQPVPSDWVTIQDEFINISCTYQTHLSRDLLMSPQARLDDGVIHITIVRAGLSKMRLIDLFGAIDTGAHVTSSDVEIIQALAFRIEPVTEGGTIMVDGELVPYGPVQGQVLPSMARVMAMPPVGH